MFKGEVVIKKVDTKANLADAMTKPLSEDEMSEHVRLCGSSAEKSRHPIAPRVEVVEYKLENDEAGTTANIIRW